MSFSRVGPNQTIERGQIRVATSLERSIIDERVRAGMRRAKLEGSAQHRPGTGCCRPPPRDVADHRCREIPRLPSDVCAWSMNLSDSKDLACRNFVKKKSNSVDRLAILPPSQRTKINPMHDARLTALKNY
jgi:hypothetical protein